MSEIIFAVPRFHYASYADLYELIRLSNFETCFIDEIDQSSDNHYIVTIYNGEFGDYSGSRAKIHLLDLEYHMGDNALPTLPNVEIFACDKWYAEQIGAKYVPMGSHVGLKPAIQESGYWWPAWGGFDVAYIGFITGLHRREVIRQQLIDRGVEVSPIVAWGTQRDALLRASKAYLHVHQHAHIPTIAPLRMVVAAAYSLPVISETCADAGIFTKDYLFQDGYDTLAKAVDDIRRMNSGSAFESWRTGLGAALHQLLCEDLTFRRSIESAL